MKQQDLSKINEFIAQVKVDQGIKNDAQLCRVLGIFPPVLSKTKSGKLAFGSTLLLQFHETFNIPVATIRELTGVAK